MMRTMKMKIMEMMADDYTDDDDEQGGLEELYWGVRETDLL